MGKILAMRNLFIWVGCVVMLNAVQARGDAQSDAFKQIEGKWKAIVIEKGGKRMPDEILKQAPEVIEFADGKMRRLLMDKVVHETNFMIDPAGSPRTFEMHVTDRKGKEKTIRGIYEVTEKGELRMCFTTGDDPKPPKSFNTQDTPASQLTVYERAK